MCLWVRACARVCTYICTSSITHAIFLVDCSLQVADKLFSSFGQDILDALFWTATEPRGKKREHLGLLPHLALAVLYVCILQELL